MEKIFNYLKLCQEHPKSEMAAFGFILHNFVTNLKPEVVFEIGTHKGRSTHIMLNALEYLHRIDKNYKGKLYSIDIRDTSYAIAETNPLRKYWTFIKGDSSQYDFGKPIDFLLIDGGHKYSEIRADYLKYEPLVKKGSYILMHDTVLCPGVKKVFEEEVKHPKTNLNWQYGMGIIQKI